MPTPITPLENVGYRLVTMNMDLLGSQIYCMYELVSQKDPTEEVPNPPVKPLAQKTWVIQGEAFSTVLATPVEEGETAFQAWMRGVETYVTAQSDWFV